MDNLSLIIFVSASFTKKTARTFNQKQAWARLDSSNWSITKINFPAFHKIAFHDEVTIFQTIQLADKSYLAETQAHTVHKVPQEIFAIFIFISKHKQLIYGQFGHIKIPLDFFPKVVFTENYLYLWILNRP